MLQTSAGFRAGTKKKTSVCSSFPPLVLNIVRTIQPDYMKNSKLIPLLKTFSAKEIKRFVEYSRSPYFNKSKNLILFCELLAAAYPDFTEKKVEKTLLHTQIFGTEKPYHDATLRNLISDAMQLAEGFLAQENSLLAPIRQELAIAQELVMRNMFTLAEKKIAAIHNELERTKATDGYYYEWRTHYDRLTDYLFYKQQLIDKRNEALQQKMDNLFCFFWTYTFRLYAVMLNLQYNTTAHPYNLSEMEAAWKIFKPSDYSDNPQLLGDYYAAALARHDATWDTFLDFFQFLQQHQTGLSNDSQIRFNTYLTNYLHRQNHAHSQSQTMLLDLYLHNVTLHEQRREQIPAWLFNNVTDIGYWVKGKEWLQQFIADYQSHLLPEIREGWLMFVDARICFNEGKFKDAIALLASHSKFHEQEYFYGKPLMLIAYYEIDEYDAFYNLLDSVKHTLARRRNELPPVRYEALKNLLSFLPKLYKMRYDFNISNFQRLQTELEMPDTRYHFKNWLQQKLAALAEQHRIVLEGAKQ